MRRNYANNWEAKRIEVNFNQKQWRQDLASFMIGKLGWFKARVSRSKVVEKKSNVNDSTREFEIYDYNHSCKVKYRDKNRIIFDSDSYDYQDVLEEYLRLKEGKHDVRS